MRKKLLWILGSFLLLLAILVGFFHTPFVKSKILNHLQETLAQSLNLSLSAQSLDYNLFTLRISLKKPIVGTHDNSTFPPFFQADELVLWLTPALILGKEIDIRDIRVVNPRMDIRANPDGTFNIPPELFRESEEPAPPLFLRNISIEGGVLSYRDQVSGLQTNIPGIHLSGTLMDKGKQELNLRVGKNKIGPAQLVYQNKRLRLESVNITARLDSQDVNIILNATELQGNEPIHINGQIHWKDNRLSIPQLHIMAAGGEISGNGDFYQKKGKSETGKQNQDHLSLTWESLNLQSPLLTAYFPHPLYSKTSGRLDLVASDFSLDGLQGNAEITLVPLKTPVPKANLVPLAGGIKAHLEPGIISVQNFNFTAAANRAQKLPYTHVNGNFFLKNRQFQGELNGSFKGEQAIDGNIRVSGEMKGDFSNPRIRAQLEGKGIQWGSQMILVPRGDLNYENRLLKTRDLVIRIMGKNELILGQLGISGIFPLVSPLAGKPNPLDITINAKEIPLEQLMSYFQTDFSVQGTLSMAAHVLPNRIQADFLLVNGSYRMLDQTKVIPGEIIGRFQLVKDILNYHLRVPELSVEITGAGRMVPPYPLQGTAYIDIPDFDKLSQRQGFDVLDGISGNMTGQVNFGLDMNNALNTAKVEANIEKFFMRTWGKELENQAPIRISFTPAGITVESLKLKGPGSLVQVNGFLPLIKSFFGGSPDVSRGQFFQKAPPLAAGGTEGLTFSAQIDPALVNPFIDPYRFSGGISLETLVSGSVTEPVVSSELILKEFSIEGESLWPGIGTEKGPNSRLEGRIKISGNPWDFRELMAEADFSGFRLDIPGFPAVSSVKPVKFRLEKGQFLVDQFCLTDESNWSQLDVSGAVNITDRQSLDLRVTGEVDAKLVGSFLEEIQLAGKNSLDLRVSGEIQKPEISGSLDLQNIEMRYFNPNLYISQLNGKLRLSRERIILETLKGNLNGGPMTLDGEISYDDSGIREMELKLTTKDSHFEYPPGLFSEVSGGLTLTFDGKDYLLKGMVDISEGVYKEPFNVMSELFTYIRGTPIVPVPEEVESFWERLNLDIGLHTSSQLLINNNISRSQLSADLSLRGSYNYPALSGRLIITEGGEIYLGSNRYSIESGIINFVNPYRIEPDLRLRARTKVQNYDIGLDLSGTPETLKASFTSTPALSEPNIISLLVTGKTLESVSGSLLDTTGSQALSYISSTFSGKIQQFTKQKLGIDQVRIDGSLIASKDNPGARLTVGQRLTSNLELTLSQDLKQAQNRSWILDYAPFANVTIQGVKQDNEQYSAALMHDIRFRLGTVGFVDSGDIPKAAKKNPPKPAKIRDIQFNGDIGIPMSTLRCNLKLREGKTFNYFKFQADLERLRNLYLKNNYPWADIKSKRQEENGKITIIYTIDVGPQIFLEFQGAAFPSRLRKRLVKLWSEGQFVQQSTKNVIRALSLFFFKKGYCQAKVSAGPPETVANNVHHYPFTIEKGLKYHQVRFLFQGSRLISGKRLLGFLKKSQLKWLVFQQPERVARELSQYYRDRGFLAAMVREPGIRFLPLQEKVIVTFHVEEGPLFTIQQISFTGNRLLDGETLLKAIGVKKNQVFSPGKFNEAKFEITAAYARKGFNDIRVTSQKQITKEKGAVDLMFGIEENLRGVIREITLTGNSLTRTSVIRRELSFKEGDILDFQEINKSRKKLYDLGIFQQVNIETVPISTPGEKEINKGFRVEIQLNEIKPYRLKTGLRWDTEKFLGVVAELDNPNIAGRAHYLGTSFSIDNKETNVKTYYRFPYFLGKKIATEFFVFTGKKKEPSFTVNRSGLTFQQQFRPGKTLVFSWNYTWERTHTFWPLAARGALFEKTAPLDPPQKLFIEDAILNLAHVTMAFSYDRRNSLMNPTRGFFFSASFQHAARFLGSDANFSRFFSECHWYVPFGRFLISATSIRIGLGKGLGQENLPGERFFAGGGGTIRGFGQNMVGPLDPEGNPMGGEALFIVKQELRVRLHDLLSIVLFTDLGNVYNSAAEFDMSNLRKSAGFGIRIHTDPLLLRLDWGFKLDRQPGESPSRIFISIGQAF